ncbi:MAG TPA: NAD-dependent epimerase/dehydratase family protein [Anaerolineales bacterium]|nr:NAD-dependent epimerase/dehydratase family protein [Anaerolineales bacterium]
MPKSYLVTGGTGFLGSAFVTRLTRAGHRVRVLDNNSRGRSDRLRDVAGQYEFVEADIRDSEAVWKACHGMDSVCHLAYINGTEFFYSKPDLVLDIAVTGMMNILNGCLRAGIGELVLASSSEVYQTPPVVPTDETVPLSVPDPLNPRYSYGGGKIICELLAVNYGRKHFERVLIFRPHNVYGPDMGWEHVVPQFTLRMKELCHQLDNPLPFPIQGSGEETRAFVYIDDFTDGLALMIEKGEHLGIYHIGTQEEITVRQVAEETARYFGREIKIVPGRLQPGGTPRRCPDITKLSQLGYTPKIPFGEGLQKAAQWYDENSHLQPMKGT